MLKTAQRKFFCMLVCCTKSHILHLTECKLHASFTSICPHSHLDTDDQGSRSDGASLLRLHLRTTGGHLFGGLVVSFALLLIICAVVDERLVHNPSSLIHHVEELYLFYVRVSAAKPI